MSDIVQVAREVLVQAGYSKRSRDDRINKLQRGSGLTEAREMLLFYYMKRFESLKVADHIILKEEGLTPDPRELVHVAGEKIIVGLTAKAKELRGRVGTFDRYSDTFVLIDGECRHLTTGNILTSCPVCGEDARHHPSGPCLEGSGK